MGGQTNVYASPQYCYNVTLHKLAQSLEQTPSKPAQTLSHKRLQNQMTKQTDRLSLLYRHHPIMEGLIQRNNSHSTPSSWFKA